MLPPGVRLSANTPVADALPPRAAPPSKLALYASLFAYQVVYAAAFLGFLLWRMLFDGRYRRGFLQRFGLVPRSASGAKVVWIHGVSVGEVKAAGSLIRKLHEELPELELLISATTPTGYALARDLHPELRVIYYPFDFGPFPSIALRRVAPSCVLLMELEVWPNFLHCAANRGVPVAVINGRISEQSFRGYRLARAFMPQFHLIRLYCMQDEVYRQRLLDLRVDPACALVTGNMKYDNVRRSVADGDRERLRDWLSPDGRPVLVCGSTHGGEEGWLAAAATDVARNLGTKIRTVLAPRHPERAPGVRDALHSSGYTCAMWSQQMRRTTPLRDDELVIVDTIGHLERFYSACDVAFIGGSLEPRGGQNMMEAAALGKAVVFGPHVSNFRKDVQLLLESDAACQIEGLADLRVRLRALFQDADTRRQLGERAAALIERNQGSTNRTFEVLRPLLD
ncbi:MAG: hypothetical protein H6837_00820 [Planctomycetes bacterium]|nr:hypothetical protein [Planctomycetota bacterium]